MQQFKQSRAADAPEAFSGPTADNLSSIPISIDKFKLAGWDILEAPDSESSTNTASRKEVSLSKEKLSGLETVRELTEEIQTGIHASLEKRFERKLQEELELMKRSSRRQNWLVIAAAVFGSLVAGLIAARFL
jgi:hypothetical protein